MSKIKLIFYAPKAREDFIVAVTIRVYLFADGQMLTSVEKGVNP